MTSYNIVPDSCGKDPVYEILCPSDPNDTETISDAEYDILDQETQRLGLEKSKSNRCQGLRCDGDESMSHLNRSMAPTHYVINGVSYAEVGKWKDARNTVVDDESVNEYELLSGGISMDDFHTDHPIRLGEALPKTEHSSRSGDKRESECHFLQQHHHYELNDDTYSEVEINVLGPHDDVAEVSSGHDDCVYSHLQPSELNQGTQLSRSSKIADPDNQVYQRLQRPLEQGLQCEPVMNDNEYGKLQIPSNDDDQSCGDSDSEYYEYYDNQN